MRSTRLSLRGLTAAALAGMLLLAGCSTAPYRQAATDLNTLTATALKAQQVQLDAYSKADQDRIIDELAAQRVAVFTSPDCSSRLNGTLPKTCTLVTAPDGRAVPNPFVGENIRALGSALARYTAALSAIAATSDADNSALSTALLSVSGQVSSLDGTVAQLTGSRIMTAAQYTAIGKIAGTLGGLYFDQRRYDVLRKIVVATDSLVGKSADLLAGVDEQLRYDTAEDAYAAVYKASLDYKTAIRAGANKDVLHKKLVAVYDTFAIFKQRAASQSAFLEIKQDHNQLALLAKLGASNSEILAVLVRLSQALADITANTRILAQ